MRMERPPSLLFWSSRANQEICISELYCPNRTFQIWRNCSCDVFQGTSEHNSITVLLVLLGPGSGVPRGRQGQLSNTDEICEPSWACEYVQSPTPVVCDYELSQSTPNQELGEVSERKKRIIKHYGAGTWGPLVVWRCFGKKKISWLFNSLKCLGSFLSCCPSWQRLDFDNNDWLGIIRRKHYFFVPKKKNYKLNRFTHEFLY